MDFMYWFKCKIENEIQFQKVSFRAKLLFCIVKTFLIILLIRWHEYEMEHGDAASASDVLAKAKEYVAGLAWMEVTCRLHPD